MKLLQDSLINLSRYIHAALQSFSVKTASFSRCLVSVLIFLKELDGDVDITIVFILISENWRNSLGRQPLELRMCVGGRSLPSLTMVTGSLGNHVDRASLLLEYVSSIFESHSVASHRLIWGTHGNFLDFRWAEWIRLFEHVLRMHRLSSRVLIATRRDEI